MQRSPVRAVLRHLVISGAFTAAAILVAPPARAEVLADFGTERDFFFGLATAPAHVEDNLHDVWIDFAEKGGVKSFWNQAEPARRLDFWSNPDTELDLAAGAGITVLRMGIDWGRLVPHRPGTIACGPDGTDVCPLGVQDFAALAHYKDIVARAHARGLNVMMTLFHHSVPRWAQAMGGWTNPDLIPLFVAFSQDVISELAEYVDYWVTFNEATLFAGLTYVGGLWPPGVSHPVRGFWDFTPLFQGPFTRAVDNMARAHGEVYAAAHILDNVIADVHDADPAPAKVGIAQNLANYVPSSIWQAGAARLSRGLFNYKFTDEAEVINNLDYVGINYYGAEFVQGLGIELRSDEEYSQSGRAIDPNGFYQLLLEAHNRFNIALHNRTTSRPLPFIITENGIADESDKLRPAYLVEHLLAVQAARKAGVPIVGYNFWTISDNWEWGDGYCPKFGLVEVDRANNLRRYPRASYFLYKQIALTHKVTSELRSDIQDRLTADIAASDALTADINECSQLSTAAARERCFDLKKVKERKPKVFQPFCRGGDGETALDEPTYRPLVDKDWRFHLP